MQASMGWWHQGAAARAALLALASLLLPALASGHARLAASEPADGAVLEQAPSVVALTFSEPVRPASLRLFDPAGARQPAALESSGEGVRVMALLPAGLPPGGYALEYRVLAADGHAVRGTVAFSLVAAPIAPAASELAGQGAQPSAPAPTGVAPPAVDPIATVSTTEPADYRLVAWAARATFLLLLLLAAGQALFCVLLPVPEVLATRVRRSLALLALGGMAVAPVHLQTTGLLALGTPGLLDLEAWQLAAGSSVGRSISLAVPGFLLLAFSVRYPRAGLLIAGAALLLFSRALTGHPASRDPGWLLMPAMVLHVACVAWWYGSLWPLGRTLASQPPDVAARLVARFSVLALSAVALLAFAGLMMALVHLAAPAALAGTDYGRLLVGKLALFALLLALAAWHKLALVPRLARGDVRAAGVLRGSIVLEAAVMTLLLLVSVALTGSAPELPEGGFWR